jgi:soluble lytic murein transglycosylase
MKKTIQFLLASTLLVGALLGFYFFYPHVWGEVLYPLEYRDLIKKYSLEYQLDPNLVCAVIYTESRFNADSGSGAGAQGLMQIMPATGRGISQRIGEATMGNLLDAETSIRYGTFHLREQLDTYNNDLDLVLASYNAGGGRAVAWRLYGEALPRETAFYLVKVKDIKNTYDTVYGKWWTEPEVKKPEPFYKGIQNFQSFVNSIIIGR